MSEGGNGECSKVGRYPGCAMALFNICCSHGGFPVISLRVSQDQIRKCDSENVRSQTSMPLHTGGFRHG
jgi:hypothetical protein